LIVIIVDGQLLTVILQLGSECVRYCLFSALDRPSNQFFSVSLCVCEQIGCQKITSAILYWFSPTFACGSEMWSLRRVLFVWDKPEV